MREKIIKDLTPMVRELEAKDRVYRIEARINKLESRNFKLIKGKTVVTWGGYDGVIKQALRKALHAKEQMGYDVPPLDLIRIYPESLEFPVRKVIEDRKVTFYAEVNSECPINDETLVGLFKMLNALNDFGQGIHGSITVEKINETRKGREELERL
jgi:hypothetical protein